jgi:hypothetical protein
MQIILALENPFANIVPDGTATDNRRLGYLMVCQIFAIEVRKSTHVATIEGIDPRFYKVAGFHIRPNL